MVNRIGALNFRSERPPPDPDDADEVPSQSNAAAETPMEQPSTRL